MTRIFISYRIADTAPIAGRIYDRLKDAFGEANVFKDSHNIHPGDDFRGKIYEAVAACDVVLVLIGTQWLTVKDKHGNRRLDDPKDWVRTEVEIGLQRDRVRVIPAIIGAAAMPAPEDLPDSLKELAYKQAEFVRADSLFDRDIRALIHAIQSDKPAPRRRSRSADFIIVATVLLIAVLAVVMHMIRNIDPPPPTPVSVDLALGFAVDVSGGMALPVSDSEEETRYQVTRDVIFRIVNTPGMHREWLTLRTIGGGIGNECRSTNRVRSGRQWYPLDFLNPLDRLVPQGNTAYGAGLSAAFDDMSLATAQEHILFVFLSSLDPSDACPDDRFNVELMLDRFQSADISIVLCAFTFFDDADFVEYRARLEEAGVDCVHNATTEDDANAWVDIAVAEINRARESLPEQIVGVATPPPTGEALETIFAPQTFTPTVIAAPTMTLTLALAPTSTPTFLPLDAEIEARSGPGLQYPVAATFTVETLYRVLGNPDNVLGVSEDRSWLQIRLEDGALVWVSIAGEGQRLIEGLPNVPIISYATETNTPTATATASATATPTIDLASTQRAFALATAAAGQTEAALATPTPTPYPQYAGYDAWFADVQLVASSRSSFNCALFIHLYDFLDANSASPEYRDALELLDLADPLYRVCEDSPDSTSVALPPMVFPAYVELQGFVRVRQMDESSMLVVYNENNLYIILPETREIALDGMRIESFRDGQWTGRDLISYPRLAGFIPPNGTLTAPTCLRLESAGGSIPQVCQDANNPLVQNLNAADVFWYNSNRNEVLPVRIVQYGVVVANCPTPGVVCAFEYPQSQESLVTRTP